MEKKLNLKSEQYFTGFKDAVSEKIIELGFDEKSKINDLLEFVYEYERLTFSKDDLSKRKRVKNPSSFGARKLRMNWPREI